MAVANALAYYDRATITAVKSVAIQAPEACIIKLFTAIMDFLTLKASVFDKASK